MCESGLCFRPRSPGRVGREGERKTPESNPERHGWRFPVDGKMRKADTNSVQSSRSTPADYRWTPGCQRAKPGSTESFGISLAASVRFQAPSGDSILLRTMSVLGGLCKQLRESLSTADFAKFFVILSSEFCLYLRWGGSENRIPPNSVVRTISSPNPDCESGESTFSDGLSIGTIKLRRLAKEHDFGKWISLPCLPTANLRRFARKGLSLLPADVGHSCRIRTAQQIGDVSGADVCRSE